MTFHFIFPVQLVEVEDWSKRLSEAYFLVSPQEEF